MTKQCTSCSRDLAQASFNIRRASADGLQPICRKCQSFKDRRRAKRPEVKIRKRQNIVRFFANPENSEKRAEYSQRHRTKYPLKNKTRHAVTNAVRDHKLTRQPCSVCGELNAHAHHIDYRKPFQITWFCRKHHLEIAHNQTFRKAITK
jgi:hypothetical protein